MARQEVICQLIIIGSQGISSNQSQASKWLLKASDGISMVLRLYDDE